jgi:two-component sensor histidine kinase
VLVWGGAATLAAGIAAVLAVVLGSLLEKPLVAAANAARQFGRGAEVSVSPSGLHEIDELTGALQDAAARQRLMIAELTHRVKNILSVVQSLVSRSIVDGRPAKDAREQVSERIGALARAHDALVKTEWRGASLEGVVRAELAVFADRVAVGGPMVFLKPSAVQSFGLVLHELATNAVKYGALSVPNGSVSVRWETTGSGSARELRLRWQEKDGHAVAAPSSKGFGTTLLESAWGEHRTNFRYAPEGFSYDVRVPLEQVTADAAKEAPAGA